MDASHLDADRPDGFDTGTLDADRRRSYRQEVVTLGRLLPEDTYRPVRPPRSRMAFGATGSSSFDADEVTKVLVLDVSLTGCRFRCPDPLEVGDFHRIEVNVGPLRLSSRLRVTRVLCRGDAAYDVGGEFV